MKIFPQMSYKALFSKIRVKYAAVTTLLVGVISLFIFLYFPAKLKQQAISAVAAKAHSITEMAAFGVSPALYFEDLENAEEALKGAKQNKDLAYIIVRDNSGGTFVEFNKADAERANFSSTGEDGSLSTDGSVYRIAMPILHNQKKIGQLYVGISLKEIRTEITNSRNTIALVSLVIFLIGMIAMYTISAVLTRPLSHMVRTVERISNGDWSQRAVVSSRDEVGHLARSFNQMITNLEKVHRDLEEMARNLEKRVEERTDTLQREVSERRKAEEEVRRSQQTFQTILQSMPFGVAVIGRDRRIQHINNEAMTLMEYDTEEQILGRNCYDMLCPAEEGKCPVLDSGDMVDRYEQFLMTKNGAQKPILKSVVPLKLEGEDVLLEAFVDISERRKLQEQLLQSEKMSAIGQLISGVAHELNNPLTGVLGFSQLLLTSTDIPEKAKHSLQTINQEAERARKIVQNLLTFARQHRTTKKKVLVNDILNRTLDLRAYELRVSNIEVVRTFDHECPPVLADEHQLQQVFMNLVINAEQAMLETHGKGRLDVNTRCDFKRNVVQVSICDDGPGIPEENLTKIFDPFFTTKSVGKGTGLGLSISYGIIQEHGGLLLVSSEQGQGTTFTIELPFLKVNVIESEMEYEPTQENIKIQRKKVLVVDDESAVVDFVKEVLEGEGHMVNTAYDGDSALEKIQEDHYDAVISDCKMPGKCGFDIYLYCKEKKPKLAKRFLFITGDVVAQDTLHFMDEYQVPHLPKPFDFKKLVSSVNYLFQANEKF